MSNKNKWVIYMLDLIVYSSSFKFFFLQKKKIIQIILFVVERHKILQSY